MTEPTKVIQTEKDTYFFNVSLYKRCNKHQKERYSVNMVQIQKEKWKASTLDDLACSVHVCQNLICWHGHLSKTSIFAKSTDVTKTSVELFLVTIY